jgi:hypothetical protein
MLDYSAPENLTDDTRACLTPPARLNYIGVFLTLDCNLTCAYCINDPLQAGSRSALFSGRSPQLTPEEWVRGLNRLPVRRDLPITLQGGEPTIYAANKGLGEIIRGTAHPIDLLTNLVLKPDKLAAALNGSAHRLRRDATYPSIRVSWHRAEMERVWGADGFSTLIEHCLALRGLGLTVSDVKSETDVGIYVVEHPDNPVTNEMRAAASGKVYLETKEFLGMSDGRLHGTYLYPFSTNLVEGGHYDRTLTCECRTSELLLDPAGFLWRCHFYLYETWSKRRPIRALDRLRSVDFAFARLDLDDVLDGWPLRPIGHILDPELGLDVIEPFRPCRSYGRCIGCDTKVKNDRFQSLFDAQVPHTPVEIRAIEVPDDLAAVDRRRLEASGAARTPERAKEPA